MSFLYFFLLLISLSQKPVFSSCLHQTCFFFRFDIEDGGSKREKQWEWLWSNLPFFSVLINLHRWMALYTVFFSMTFPCLLVTILRIDAIKFSSPLSLWPFSWFYSLHLFHGLMNANHFFSRLVASPFSLNSVYFGWFCFDLFVHSLLYPGLFQASTWLSHQVISYFCRGVWLLLLGCWSVKQISAYACEVISQLSQGLGLSINGYAFFREDVYGWSTFWFFWVLFWTGIFDRGLAGCLKAIYWTDQRSYTSLFTFFFFEFNRLAVSGHMLFCVGCFDWSVFLYATSSEYVS